MFSKSAAVQFGLLVLLPKGVQSDRIMLYENDFEAPKKTVTPPIGTGCTYEGADMMVNNNYGEQGGPNHSKTQYGSGQFGQVQTVETCSITTDIPFKDGQGTVLGYYSKSTRLGW
jgi:hypothetical protein